MQLLSLITFAPLIGVAAILALRFTGRPDTARSLPLTVATQPIFSRAWWEGKDFQASYSDTDAVIQGKEVVEGSLSDSGATVPASVLDRVRDLPEVGAAAGSVFPQEVNPADIIGADGKAVARRASAWATTPPT